MALFFSKLMLNVSFCVYAVLELKKFCYSGTFKHYFRNARTLLNIHDGAEAPFRGILRKRCSENMQEIYRRTPMLKCNFNKLSLCYGCSPVYFLHIFRTSFYKNTSGELLLTELFCEKVNG